MVAFTAMGEGTTGTPLHKGSEAQSVGAVQTPHQTEGGICVCEHGWYVCVCVVRLHRHGYVFEEELRGRVRDQCMSNMHIHNINV